MESASQYEERLSRYAEGAARLTNRPSQPYSPGLPVDETRWVKKIVWEAGGRRDDGYLTYRVDSIRDERFKARFGIVQRDEDGPIAGTGRCA